MPNALAGTLNGSGASSQGSASDAWVASFQTDNPDATVNYSPDGSGAGRKAFISGGVQYAGSDSALSETELAGTFAGCAPDSKGIDLPVYISPIAVIFNVDGVDSAQPRRRDHRRDLQGHDHDLERPGDRRAEPGRDAARPADHRRCTARTTPARPRTSPTTWTRSPRRSGTTPPADTFPYRTGEAAQGTVGVVDAVTGGVNTIGYADASQAGTLGVAQIKVGDEFVDAQPKAAAAVVAESPLVEGREANDIAIELDRKTTDPGALPARAGQLHDRLPAVRGRRRRRSSSRRTSRHVASHAGQAEAATSAGVRAARRPRVGEPQSPSAMRTAHSDECRTTDGDEPAGPMTTQGHLRSTHAGQGRGSAPGRPRRSPAALVSAGALILVTLAAVAVFLVVQSIPALVVDPKELPGLPVQLLGLRRAARLRHRLGGRARADHGGAGVARHRAVHLALRARAGSRRCSATSSTCWPRCPSRRLRPVGHRCSRPAVQPFYGWLDDNFGWIPFFAGAGHPAPAAPSSPSPSCSRS